MTTQHASLLTKTAYTTWHHGRCLYTGTSLEDAIRAWDAATVGGPVKPGGISVQTWDGGYMVRDGWILHVYDNGQVYLSPNIALRT
jgi:hypothetical protein